MLPEITVVIPTYRRPDALRRVLQALGAQTIDPSRWQLIVVDNASHDVAVDALLDDLNEYVTCETRVARIECNAGPGGARNLGWRSAVTPLVAFLDDDVVPQPDWLSAGVAAFDDPRVGIVQGRTTVPDGVDVQRLPAWSHWRSTEGVSPYFESCNIFYRRDALLGTVGFDEEIGWWGEDTAAGWQVVEAGWDHVFCPDAVVVHGIDQRSLGWFVRNSKYERNLVKLAKQYPGFVREAFWQPWAYRRRDAAFALAAASAALALRWRPALLGITPYLWVGRPSRHEPDYLERCVGNLVLDALHTATHLAASFWERRLVI